MTLKNFRYTKKKDGETKNYLVLVLDEDEKHIGGIDLSKLDDPEEVKEVVEVQKEIEKQYKQWQQEADEAGITLELLLEDEEAKARKQILFDQLQPFIKKAYRKFLIENVEQYLGEPAA